VAAGRIAALLDALAARNLQMHSLMLLRHGRVVAEGWWRPYAAETPHALYSLSKSFTSTAVGLAVHEGRLSPDDAVVSFFPDDLPPRIGPNLAAMRVRHLLSMGTGHDQDATPRVREGGNTAWVRRFLSLDVEHEPGSKFVYNSAATYMLSAIVQRVTGRTLLDYLAPRLLEPLGIRGATWESSPEGIHTGGWGLSLRTEDIACFGQLLLQEGRWGDRQLVPRDWIREATSVQIHNGGGPNPDWAQGYGYQFWRCRHGAYRGDGAWGQYCVVLPEQDAVLAMTGGTGNLQGVLDCVWEHVLPALGAGAGSAADDAALAGRLGALSLAPAGGDAPGAAFAAGGTWTFEPNAARLETLTLDFGGPSCGVRMVEGGAERRIACGWGRWEQGDPGAEPCAGHAAWEPDGTLRLDWYWVRTPFGRTLRIRADGAGVDVEYRGNVGEHANGHRLRGA
jgi:CubicO group peptidase (beta-lactamase class C family)